MIRLHALTVVLLLTLTASAQTTPAGATQTLTSTTTLVLVPTMVLSPTGDMIPNLTSDDFTLTDNGIPQTLAVEHIDHQPVSIVVLLQTGATAPAEFPFYRAIGTMLDNLVGETSHKLALVTFDSQPEELWNFPPRGDGLSYAFTHPEPGDYGAALLDAVSYAVTLLKEQPGTARRIILLISQQQDLGSKVKPEDVVRQLGESNTTIYSLTFSPQKRWLHDQFTGPRHESPLYHMPNYPPLRRTIDLGTPLGQAWQAMQTDTAAEVTSLSGGEDLHFTNKKDLEQQLQLLANRIPNRYTLSFRPTSDEPGFHSLKVEVLHPANAAVSARASYWSK